MVRVNATCFENFRLSELMVHSTRRRNALDDRCQSGVMQAVRNGLLDVLAQVLQSATYTESATASCAGQSTRTFTPAPCARARVTESTYRHKRKGYCQ